MAELLLELLSEEIPARMQRRAAEDLKRLVTKGLETEGLEFGAAEAYTTPRRLTLVVDGLAETQPDIREDRKGPRVGAPDKAIQGFLKSAGLESLDQCEVREVKGAEFYFVTSERKGGSTADVLPDILISAIRKLAWPKSMRWANTDFRWVRPLHGVLALFDEKMLKGSVALGGGADLPFGDRTRGHRFLAPKEFAVKNFDDYRKKLRDAHVMLDPAERREKIRAGAEALAKQEGLAVRDDVALLDEVTGLVEWPVVLLGKIDEEYMEVPPEVLISSMRAHQKYFSLLDGKGKLAPRFVVVANMVAVDHGKAIIAGNERVLRARLSDARFFWDQDRKRTLASRAPALKEIIFHARLGTLDDKADRVQALAVAIAGHIKGADKDRVRSAARLAKADLSTEMVGEFPDLQGIMGGYYARHDGEHDEVAAAIAEHYAPQGPADDCPSAPVSVAVALADKIDTLVGFFAIAEKPTGSRDPYGLRRAALGVIRLVVENKLRLPLLEVFAGAWQSSHFAGDNAKHKQVSAELLSFFADRLKVHLRESGVRHDLISAIFALGDEDDLVRLLARVEALGKFLETDDGANLLVAYRRAANIVRIEEKNDKTSHGGAPDESLLRQSEEKSLYRALAKAAKDSAGALEDEKFAPAMSALAGLRGPVDAFFDEVTVNCEDAGLRANRLKLLSRIRATMDHVADFSQIEG